MPAINQGWRACGLLMHPSSLYSPYGIGDLGPAAHQVAEFMKKAGFHFWQMLPLSPTSPSCGNSPYSAFSAFAGNPLLISPEYMVRDGWLTESEIGRAIIAPQDQVDFAKAAANKIALLNIAFERYEGRILDYQPFLDFIWNNGGWLNDYAFFMAVKDELGGESWQKWPWALKTRDNKALHQYGTDLASKILKIKFAQFLFFQQLAELKATLNQNGLGLIGDSAFYVNHDSSDVWSQPHLFELNDDDSPRLVAGVPPDYFSPTGQLWGNPLFNWFLHQASDFNWWKNRIWHNLQLYDWVRLDHFRAFAAYWSVPATAETAAAGEWLAGPGAELFQATGGRLPIIAEDLGIITQDVTDLRRQFEFPGMRVLQFAFGPDFGLNTHAPFRTEPDNAVFSATHDNNTTRGWFRQEATALQKQQVSELAGYKVTEENVAQAFIKMAWLSPGALAITTIQDLLGLDERARMNTPGTAYGNWGWRLTSPELLTDQLADYMAELGSLSGRDNCEHPNIQTY